MEDKVETVIHTDIIKNKNSNKHDQNFQKVCYILERLKKKKLRVHENKRDKILIKTGELLGRCLSGYCGCQ